MNQSSNHDCLTEVQMPESIIKQLLKNNHKISDHVSSKQGLQWAGPIQDALTVQWNEPMTSLITCLPVNSLHTKLNAWRSR